MKKIALFSYNFKHKKTQDFIFYLMANGYKIDLILATDPIQLNIKDNVVRSKVRHGFLIHPEEIAKRFSIPYHVVMHNSEETEKLLRDNEIDIAIITGARILKKPIIDSCKIGILNFHPALLPECRGLDSFFWSVENNIKLGVTSHLIDKGVDSGLIVSKEEITINNDDTMFDLTERLYEKQLDMLSKSIEMLSQENPVFQPIDTTAGHNSKMEEDQEFAALDKLQNYIALNGK